MSHAALEFGNNVLQVIVLQKLCKMLRFIEDVLKVVALDEPQVVFSTMQVSPEGLKIEHSISVHGGPNSF
jgi:hypothetical protein